VAENILGFAAYADCVSPEGTYPKVFREIVVLFPDEKEQS